MLKQKTKAVFQIQKCYEKVMLSQQDKDEIKGYLLKFQKGAIWSNIQQEICRDMNKINGFGKFVYWEAGILKAIPEFKKYVIQRLQNLRHGRASLLSKRGRPKADVDDTRIDQDSSFDFNKALAKGDKEEEKQIMGAFKRRRRIGLTQDMLEDLQIDYNAIDSDDTTVGQWNKRIDILKNKKIVAKELDNETLVKTLKKREIKLALKTYEANQATKKIQQLELELEQQKIAQKHCIQKLNQAEQLVLDKDIEINFLKQENIKQQE